MVACSTRQDDATLMGGQPARKVFAMSHEQRRRESAAVPEHEVVGVEMVDVESDADHIWLVFEIAFRVSGGRADMKDLRSRVGRLVEAWSDEKGFEECGNVTLTSHGKGYALFEAAFSVGVVGEFERGLRDKLDDR